MTGTHIGHALAGDVVSAAVRWRQDREGHAPE